MLVTPKFDFQKTEISYEYQPLTKYRTKKINLVLIGGKAGVGKTTAATYLNGYLQIFYPSLNISHTAFAKPIKEIATSIFHWDGNKDGKGRRLLQVIGTDAGREYNENIWVEYLENNELSGLFPNNFVFVDDWRFPNEKSYFESNFLFDITSIRISSGFLSALPQNISNHASETSLPLSEKENLVYNKDAYYNFEIDNQYSLEELYKKLDSVASYLTTKVIEY
jgi:energy-coupling factor transporter ATP-binding protein EcfA2